jgi:hypothetical protein
MGGSHPYMGDAHMTCWTAETMTHSRVAAPPTLSLALIRGELENGEALHLPRFVWTSMASWFMIGCLRGR